MRQWLQWRLMAIAASVVIAATASGQTTKAQISVGAHDYEMKVGNVYSIRVESKEFQPNVEMTPGLLQRGSMDYSVRNRFVSYYLPTKDEKNTLYVVPDLFHLKGKGPFDYEIEVTPVALNVKPRLSVNAELTANDPPFKDSFGDRPHHKAYELKVKGSEFYIIEMSDPVSDKLRTFVYLLDSDGKVVRSDFRFPISRIVFRAPQDGQYRIVCTALGEALGAFQLTVRTSEKK